jgi:hypothetical protein
MEAKAQDNANVTFFIDHFTPMTLITIWLVLASDISHVLMVI